MVTYITVLPITYYTDQGHSQQDTTGAKAPGKLSGAPWDPLPTNVCHHSKFPWSTCDASCFQLRSFEVSVAHN